MPNFINRNGQRIRHDAQTSPALLFFVLFTLSAFVLGISDLVWGAPWWIGFWKIFYLQGGRFLLYFLYLVLGASVRASGLLEQQNFMEKFSQSWRIWLLLTIVVGLIYVGYALSYQNHGAYSDTFRLHVKEFFDQGGMWGNFWSFLSQQGLNILQQDAPRVLIRTSLHGLLCLCQLFLVVSLFYRFCNTSTPLWHSLARNCYAIFLSHEVIVIWLQYYFIDVDVPIFIKILIIFMLGFGGSWLLSEKIFLKIKPLRHILGKRISP